MLIWLIPLIVVAVLVLRFSNATVPHWSSCTFTKKVNICTDKIPSLADEYEEEREPQGPVPPPPPEPVSITPQTGQLLAIGQPAASVHRQRSRVLYDSPLMSSVL